MIRYLGVLILISLVGCYSPESPKLIPKPVVQKGISENSVRSHNNKVDILFVVDNSGSMGSYQDSLSKNMQRFVDIFFKEVLIDYHIGVISTDADNPTWSAPNPMCCGRLQGNPAFIDNNTPDAAADLAQRIILGTNGSATEQSFEPVKLALTDPLASGENMGFLRPDALLAIIFITDAEDQSSISPEDFHQFLVGIKGSPEKILSYGAIIPTIYGDVSGCSRDTGNPIRIEKFLAMTSNQGNNTFNLCTSDFGEELALVATNIAARVSLAFYLDRPPIADTIRVLYGTQEIPKGGENGWSFDAQLNAVFVGKDVVFDSSQPEGTKLRVEAEYTTYDEAMQKKGH